MSLPSSSRFLSSSPFPTSSARYPFRSASLHPCCLRSLSLTSPAPRLLSLHSLRPAGAGLRPEWVRHERKERGDRWMEAGRSQGREPWAKVICFQVYDVGRSLHAPSITYESGKEGIKEGYFIISEWKTTSNENENKRQKDWTKDGELAGCRR